MPFFSYLQQLDPVAVTAVVSTIGTCAGRGLIENVRNIFVVEEIKRYYVTLSSVLHNTVLQIVFSDFNNPSTFQCMRGRPFFGLPVALYRIHMYLREVLILFALQCDIQPGGTGKRRRRSNPVSKGNGEPRQ